MKPGQLQDLLSYDTIWGVLTYAERISIRLYLLGRKNSVSEKIELMAAALAAENWVNPEIRWKNTAEQICTHWNYHGWSLERYKKQVSCVFAVHNLQNNY